MDGKGVRSDFEVRASRIEVRGLLALGGPPRRHGWTQLEKLVRLDPGRGPGTRFEQVLGPRRVQPRRRGGPPKARKPRTSILEVRTSKFGVTPLLRSPPVVTPPLALPEPGGRRPRARHRRAARPRRGGGGPDSWSALLWAVSHFRTSKFEPRGSRFEAPWPSGAPLVATAAPSAKNWRVWTPGGVRGPILSRFSVSGFPILSPGALRRPAP